MRKQKIFLLFSKFPGTFDSSLVRKVNRQALNLQLGLGLGKLYGTIFLFFSRHEQCEKSNKSLKLSAFVMFYFDFFTIAAGYGYNFVCHCSFPSPNCKLGTGLIILIILKAIFLALNKKIINSLNRGLFITKEVTKVKRIEMHG